MRWGIITRRVVPSVVCVIAGGGSVSTSRRERERVMVARRWLLMVLLESGNSISGRCGAAGGVSIDVPVTVCKLVVGIDTRRLG